MSVADVQYHNANTDPQCKRIVDRLFALDRHPRFEHDPAIRRRWQEQGDVAKAYGCKY